MFWWIVLIVVALAVIGWVVRRARTKRAVHPDESAVFRSKNKNEGNASGYGGFGF
jgi:hypothetical protein